jgi:DNA-binding GntR family transcriptional regulator
MVRKRADSFRIALQSLRGDLRAGRHPPGARLTANDIAAHLALSPTPVREALSRLAGEGLLQDRRGQGYFVPRLQERDIIALFQLQRDLMLIACEGDLAGSAGLQAARVAGASGEISAIEAVSDEQLMRTIAAAASPALVRHLARLQDQLAPVRALETLVLGRACEGEPGRLASALWSRNAERLRRELRAFFDHRIAAAPRLARLVEAGPNMEPI